MEKRGMLFSHALIVHQRTVIEKEKKKKGKKKKKTTK